MDNEVAIVVGGFLLFFGMLIGGSLYGDTLEHAVKMECIKQRGEYVGKGCYFRNAQPQQ